MPASEPLRTKRKKRRTLRETYTTYLSIVRETLGYLDGVKSRGQLHNKTYERFRSKHGVASQLIIEARSHAWANRKTIGKDRVNRVGAFGKVKGLKRQRQTTWSCKPIGFSRG